MLETVMSVIGLLGSILAIYFTVRNQSADTISKLYDALDKQEERYDDLKREFDEYKRVMSGQMSYLQSEATRWRIWAEKLSKQLKDNDIKPVDF